MKILFVMDSLGTGGAERSTADLWYFLRSKGVGLRIAVLRHRREGIEEEIIRGGFDVHFIASKGLFPQSREIARLILQYQPDVVHSILFRSNLRVRWARVTHKFVHVESLVNLSYDKVRLKDPRVGRASLYFYKLVDRLTSRWVDHFVAITTAVKNHYVHELSLPSGKISVIYRSRPENKFLARRGELQEKYKKEFGLHPGSLMILHVGRQEYQKGHTVLLNAIAYMEKKIEVPLAFLLVGREGNSTTEIKKLIGEIDIQSNLLWPGHRYDVAQLMAAADIFVFPSLYEGLGGVLLEAQAARLPIICSDLPVFNEVVVRGSSALLFDAGDHVALGKALLKLISSSALRAEMGENGHANFKNRFDQEKINQETLVFYEKMAR